MHKLLFTKTFNSSYKHIVQNGKQVEKKAEKALALLQQDPLYPSLKSHKANTKHYGERWSSWVTGDIRIIWDYDSEDRLILILLDIGGHSGKRKVYK